MGSFPYAGLVHTIYKIMQKYILSLLVCAVFSSCVLIGSLPKSSTFEERSSIPAGISGFSTPTKIYWSSALVPFIKTGSDLDLARALGIAHAHLRLGQMELFRRVVAGRLSEIAGPFSVEIDKALRILDLRGAGAASISQLDSETRVFLESYVSGINDYIANLKQLPHEFQVGGIQAEVWTIEDVLGITRLAGVDISWLLWAGMIDKLGEPQWNKYWEFITALHAESIPSLQSAGAGFVNLSRFGSNAFAVGGAFSKSGSAILAADPHVGFQLPNLWLLAGMDSPSYKTTGLMMPGLPIVLIGRNEQIAWGATNMRALSSRLFELDEKDVQAAHITESKIVVRGWFDSKVLKRKSSYGPIVSDIPRFKTPGKTLALRWIGHEASDEISALLRVMKAQNWSDFRNAFSTYAVSGQNYIYADKSGNIGQLAAVELPKDKSINSEYFFSKSSDNWSATLNSLSLPFQFNPESGFLASANNRPFPDSNNVEAKIGFSFSSNDRISRLDQLLRQQTNTKSFNIDQAAQIQSDVFSPSQHALLKHLLPLWNSQRQLLTKGQIKVLDQIRNWDGQYYSNSRAALLFHLASFSLAKSVFETEFGSKLAQSLLNSDNASSALMILLDRIAPETLTTFLQNALGFAGIEAGQRSTWGDFHQLKLQHPLGNIPLIGLRYRYDQFPVSGSGTTLMKTFTGLSGEKHLARYGANSRLLFDLSSENSTQAILLGGQDGWLSSPYFLDQVGTWQAGKYLTLPLRSEEASIQALNISILKE